MLKIFICENVPSLNKGEMTILDGMLESFSELGQLEISMLTAVPEIDSIRYMSKIKTIPIGKSWFLNGGLNYNKYLKMLISIVVMLQHIFFIFIYGIFKKRTLKIFKSEIWTEYILSDIIIEGHDCTFGTGGSLGIPYFYPIYLPYIAKMLNKKIVFYGGSVGKDGNSCWLMRKLFKFALGKMDLITLRENSSYQNIKDLNLITNKVYVTADPAFLLVPATLERVLEIAQRESVNQNMNTLIGITVTRNRAFRAFPQYNDGLLRYKKHNELFAEVIDYLIIHLNATIVFLPHCIGFGDELDDRIVANDIYKLCANKNKVKIITHEYSAAEIKGLIGQLDFLIGERLHSVINALSMGIPSIVISTSNDSRLEIVKMIWQDAYIHYVENLNSTELLNKVKDLVTNKDSIKKELNSQMEKIQELARFNGKLLKDLLDN